LNTEATSRELRDAAERVLTRDGSVREWLKVSCECNGPPPGVQARRPPHRFTLTVEMPNTVKDTAEQLVEMLLQAASSQRRLEIAEPRVESNNNDFVAILRVTVFGDWDGCSE
jgi:hypothetical protein